MENTQFTQYAIETWTETFTSFNLFETLPFHWKSTYLKKSVQIKKSLPTESVFFLNLEALSFVALNRRYKKRRGGVKGSYREETLSPTFMPPSKQFLKLGAISRLFIYTLSMQ